MHLRSKGYHFQSCFGSILRHVVDRDMKSPNRRLITPIDALSTIMHFKLSHTQSWLVMFTPSPALAAVIHLIKVEFGLKVLLEPEIALSLVTVGRSTRRRLPCWYVSRDGA